MPTSPAFCLFKVTGGTSWRQEGRVGDFDSAKRTSDEEGSLEDTEAQRGQEGVHGHTASWGMKAKAGMRHLSILLGQLRSPMPPYPFLTPHHRKEKCFRPKAKECGTEI